MFCSSFRCIDLCIGRRTDLMKKRSQQSMFPHWNKDALYMHLWLALQKWVTCGNICLVVLYMNGKSIKQAFFWDL